MRRAKAGTSEELDRGITGTREERERGVMGRKKRESFASSPLPITPFGSFP